MNSTKPLPAGTGSDIVTPPSLIDNTIVMPFSRPEVRRAARDAAAACVQRRARVLRHEDLAARLMAAPLHYSRPEIWSGYIPPARGPYGAKWPDDRGRSLGVDEAINTSPMRLALMEILNAVVEREAQQEARDAA